MFNTSLLHDSAGSYENGATQAPVYQVSAFAHESAEKLEKVFANRAPGFAYTRVANPTVAALERRIAALEHGAGAVACASGMSAVTMALLNILQAGDEVIAGTGAFGGTIELLDDLVQFGITVRFADTITAGNVEKLINDRTRAVFAELIGNPKLDIVDIRSVSEVCHRCNVPLIIDSTTATPYLIHPLEHGADIVIHSTSKYINGGGNAIGGIITDSGEFNWYDGRFKGFEGFRMFGKFAYQAKLRNGIWRDFGACMAPVSAYMNSVGIDTLGLRMERICLRNFSALRTA